MLLKFLGTRGGIIAKSKKHYFHSSLMITYKTKKIIIDCGKDWLGNFEHLDVNAIFITHAHSDHIGGLASGTACRVYATEISWSKIKKYQINQKKIVVPREPIFLGPIEIEAFEVEHSIHAPAIGYKITADNKSIFYVPDLVKIKEQKEALKNVSVYIGDGAIIKRKLLIRKKNSTIVGHAPISEQLFWCKKEKIPVMIITHCGSEIVKHTSEETMEKLEQLSQEYNVKIILAYDGLEISI